MPETVAELSRKTEVREALAQTRGKPKVKAQTTDKFWFVTHALVQRQAKQSYVPGGSKSVMMAGCLLHH